MYVAFLSDNPIAENIEKWELAQIHPDIAVLIDNVMYLKFFESAGKSKLSNNLIESRLKVTATTRNWNTTLKLMALLDERK